MLLSLKVECTMLASLQTCMAASTCTGMGMERCACPVQTSLECLCSRKGRRMILSHGNATRRSRGCCIMASTMLEGGCLFRMCSVAIKGNVHLIRCVSALIFAGNAAETRILPVLALPGAMPDGPCDLPRNLNANDICNKFNPMAVHIQRVCACGVFGHAQDFSGWNFYIQSVDPIQHWLHSGQQLGSAQEKQVSHVSRPCYGRFSWSRWDLWPIWTWHCFLPVTSS